MDIRKLEEAAHCIKIALESASSDMRLSTTTTLRIEFANMHGMHAAYQEMLQDIRYSDYLKEPKKRTDLSIEFELMGLTVVFICNERIRRKDAPPVGFNSVNFVEWKPKNK